MLAAVVDRYGPPECVTVREVPTPRPRAGEVLVRVEAAAVTAGDARIRAARFPPGFALPARLALGLKRPRRRILGGTFAGRVEALGPGVDDLAFGAEIAGMNGIRLGAHAEFLTAPARSLVRRPSGLAPGDAAGVLFGGATALHFLRERAGIQPGDRVLVNGASGAVGTSAVQVARHFGAHVTAVTSAANRELVGRLGAHDLVDYTTAPHDASNWLGITQRYDIVLDAVGNLSRADGLRLLTPRGRLILAAASLWETVRSRGRVITGPAPERPQDVEFLLRLAAEGRLDPVTRTLGGLDSIQEAHRRVDSGRKVGNLVILPDTRG